MTEIEMKRVDAEISKLIAETAKINKETIWYPMVVMGGIFAGMALILKFVLN